MEDKVVCDICQMEFADKAEHDAHHEMAHMKDPLGEDSNLQDTDDPNS